MDMSQPDDDGVYRNGATKRKARTELAMQCLTELWNAACKDVSFPVPDSGIGFAAVGSLARGQLGPSSDLDLVIIYEPRTLNDQQLNELANKLWYPLWDSGLDLDHSIRTRAQCEEVTDHDLPAAMGWLDVKPIAGDTALITTTATSILERWRKAARKRHMGWRPTVRGSVMTPNDHPHGGGEGKSPIGRPSPVTPWGKPAMGYKTRSKKNPTNKFIVKRRNDK